MPKVVKKQMTFRTTMNRLKKVHSAIELALLNPEIFEDATLPEVQEIIDTNLKYLRHVEKNLISSFPR